MAMNELTPKYEEEIKNCLTYVKFSLINNYEKMGGTQMSKSEFGARNE